jgi:hypothetical protein
MPKAKKGVPQPATPTLDKLRFVKDKSQAIGEFLEWLMGEQKVQLMLYHELAPERRNIERLLADFFEINLDEVEKERRALLDWMRKVNGC